MARDPIQMGPIRAGHYQIFPRHILYTMIRPDLSPKRIVVVFDKDTRITLTDVQNEIEPFCKQMRSWCLKNNVDMCAGCDIDWS